MENIAVWGCRDGRHVYEEILKKASDKYNIVAFCDNADKYVGVNIDSIPIIKIDELVELHKEHRVDTVIVAVRKGYSRYCIIKELKIKGINNILLVKPAVLTYNLPIVFDESDELYNKQWLNINDCQKPIIHHLEINIADGCNLNCRGCLHFSNLYKSTDFPDADELLETITEISKHCEVFQFRVLGGEPLLYSKLPSFLEKLRQILPNTDLAVISNGILIPRYDTSLYKVMNNNCIGFNLTLYEPTLMMKDMIYDTLKKYNVAYGSHESKCEKFEKFLRITPGSQNAFKTCEPRGILVVKERYIYRCPIEAYIEKMYQEYDIDLKAPQGIDVYEDAIDWEELIDDLYTKPRPLCTFCSEKSEYYEWSNGKPELDDWIVN